MPTHKDLPLDDVIDAEVIDDLPTNPKADPKPNKSAAAGIIDAEVVPDKPTVGERVLNRVGLPKDELGKLKSEPWQGIKGLTKAQFNVAPQAVEDIAAARAAAKAGREALKATGATKESVEAAKTAARDGVKLAAGEFTKIGAAKFAAKAVPVIGSVYSAYEAFNDFKDGRIVAGALDLIGVIPGPVGWVGMGASMLWKSFGEDRIGEWDQPDGTSTFMLQGSAKDVGGVKDIDAKLREAQGAVFNFQDGPTGTVWNSNAPAALRVDGKSGVTSAAATATGISGLAMGALSSVVPGSASTNEIQALATEALAGISAHFAAIDDVFAKSGEQYFTEQRQALAPTFEAMAKFKTQVTELMAQLTAVSDGAAVQYKAVLDANVAARQQLASDGKLTDQGPAQTLATKLQQGGSAIAAGNDKITKMFAETPPAVVLLRGDTPVQGQVPAKTETPKPVTATPAAVTPAAQTPSIAPKTETPQKTDDTLSKLLSQLGQQGKTPTASNPLGTGSGLGGGSPLGTGTGGGNTGSTPLSSSKPDTSEKSEPKKLVDDRKLGDRKTEEPKKLGDDKSLSTPKPEQAKAAVPAGEQKPAAVPAGAVPALGAAAPTPAQQNAAHAAAQAEPSKEVDVKGQKTAFPDAKTAKLAELLAKADPTHPVSLADAAKSAGLTPPVPGQDPGKQIPPAEAKPGDIMVAGDKNFMLLGDGKFYDLQDYKVIGSSELPQNMGDRAGYFHLNDPNPGSQPPQGGQPGQPAAPAPAQPQGPVSPQSTNGVQNAVPGATAAPVGPSDASQGSQPAAGTPAAPTGGVPSTGAPGVPKPGGSGPANAESTSTGTGQGGVSSGGQALDPGAVR